MVKKSYLFLIITSVVFGLTGCKKEHQHSYDFSNPQWTWEAKEDGNGYVAKATVTCAGCEETNEGHALVLDASVSSTTVNPTCENDGSITYTATATYNDKTLNDSKTDSIDKLGHIFNVMTVEGNYRTSYTALESFDSSNLVVKISCSREGCNEVKTLSQDEYFVIYETQGIDHLCAGDTKVTISANYAPFARHEISGLTVSKIANSINGLEASYVTGCRHAPDLSGVTALSGDIQYTYYLDSNCTQEISVNDLVLGTYYLKATATGDVNYETVSQTVTLTVSHTVEQCLHIERVEPTLYKNGSLEYWLCEGCGTAFKNESLTEVYPSGTEPSDPSDERYIAPIGETIEETLIRDSLLSDNVTISTEPVPQGYAFTSVYVLENANIRNIFDNYAVVDDFSKISFAIKTTSKWFSCRGEWWDFGTWKIFELVKLNNNTWDIYGASEGNALTLRHLSVPNNVLSADDNDISKSILGLSCENDACYVTNIRAIRDGEVDDINSSYMNPSVLASTEQGPSGFVFKKVYSLTNSNISGVINASANVEGVTKITFAFKTTTIWYDCCGKNTFDISPAWKIFILKHTSDGVWDVSIISATSFSMLKHFESVSGSTLATILALKSEPDTSYITNLRIIRDSKVKIADFAVAGSELVSDTVSSFLQFKQVYKKTLPGEDSFQGQAFIQTPANLDDVIYAEFAFMTTNRPFSWSGWSGSLATNTWHIAKFTFNDDNTVTCDLCLLDGTVKHTYENKPSFAEAMLYYNYSGSNPAPDFYSTEIRAFVR